MRGKTARKAIKRSAVVGFMAALALAAMPSPFRAQGPPPGAPPQAQAAPPVAAPGWLGVAVDEVTPDTVKQLKLPADRGVVIAEAQDGSPAAKGGLEKGDAVTEFDGERVVGMVQFQRLVRETPPGRTVQLSIWRDGRSRKLSVEMGSAPVAAGLPGRQGNGNRQRGGFGGGVGGGFGGGPGGPNQGPNGGPGFGFRGGGGGNPGILGITVQDLTVQLGNYFGVPNAGGVLVTDVPAGSPGDKAGLKAGDVITKVEGMAVPDTTELQGLVQQKRDAQSIALTVVRKGAETQVNVQPQTPSAPQRRNGQGVGL
jgi:serine protease Do